MVPADELAGKTVLVTGASGFLGSRTVAHLAERGCLVRALVRKTSRTDHLRLPNVSIAIGDVTEAESLQPAFESVDYVIHAAADTSGGDAEGNPTTVQGTKNILALCERFNVSKLVYISSCSVYGVVDYRQGEVVTEESTLERFPEKRGPYSHSKFKAEQLVARALKSGTVPIVCLRPGTIYGPGGEIYTPMIGFALGRSFFAVIGDGSMILPLVYVDNMVEAIIVALANPNSANKIYNVVDPERVTKKDYMERLVKKLYPGALILYIPFGVLKGITFLQERLCSALRIRPFLTMYRLVSSQKPILYDASKIRNDLDWNPPVTVETAYNDLITYERGRN